jgi:hypothetical protein
MVEKYGSTANLEDNGGEETEIKFLFFSSSP